MKNQKFQGFTLIELLAVIAVMGIAGSIVFGILYTTLRGSTRSDRVTILQQNGNFALTQMVKMIRFSRKLEDPAPCFISDTQTSVTTTSLTIRNVDDKLTTFSCTGLPDGTIASNGASLLNTTSVAVVACAFTCRQPTLYDTPSIDISFTLNQKNSNNLVENSSPIPFQATVTLRNLID